MLTTTTTSTASGWVYDEHGNRASLARWGSEQAARASLATLKDCNNCSDCTECAYCNGCSRCSRCIGCIGCRDCYGCVRSHQCDKCHNLTDCYSCTEFRQGERCAYCGHGSGGVNDSGLWKVKPSASDGLVIAGYPVPAIKDIHRKVYAAASQPGALDMSDCHSRYNVHCRAGWVVWLAGLADEALEKVTSTLFLAQQIYKASGYDISPARFYDDNDTALEHMRALAESEK
jgi:hypothetical protein